MQRTARRGASVATTLRAAALGVGFAAAFGVSLSANAQPSVWQRAAEPFARERGRLHAQVLQAQQQRGAVFAALLGQQALEGALAQLREAGVPERADPVLEFDFGDLLSSLERHEQAIAVYERAIARWPEAPRAQDALLSLAFAHAKLDRSERELFYYRAYLRAAARPWGQATATMNMAEAHMRLGRLGEAVSGYREAYRLASQRAGTGSASDTAALASYGLAVALDRQGDPRQAEQSMAAALALDPELRLLTAAPSVFFVPAYERAFYIGLALETQLRQSQAKSREMQQLGLRAVGAYRDYLQRAGAADRWVRRVRERERELVAWLRAKGISVREGGVGHDADSDSTQEFEF